MNGGIESAADTLSSTPMAKPRATDVGVVPHSAHSMRCLNCGTLLTTHYCGYCGQPAHIHRTLSSLGHDILHGVFHFEGKFWSTLPQLFFFPGHLTRRYVDGERARFVSPMALYLFAVFTMFAVASLTAGSHEHLAQDVQKGWHASIENTLAANERRIDSINESLEDDNLTPRQKQQLESELADLDKARAGMEAILRGDWNGVSPEATTAAVPAKKRKSGILISQRGLVFTTGWTALDGWLNAGASALAYNPGLLLYKLKTTTYKYSWLLIPLSVPFVWLLFFWRRDLHLYDHAIFVSHSITFMMLFGTLISLLAFAGLSAAIWGPLLVVTPPIHMYKHLRATYQLSRGATWIRLFLLCVACLLVLAIFCVVLLVLGAIG